MENEIQKIKDAINSLDSKRIFSSVFYITSLVLMFAVIFSLLIGINEFEQQTDIKLKKIEVLLKANHLWVD